MNKFDQTTLAILELLGRIVVICVVAAMMFVLSLVVIHGHNIIDSL